LEVAEKGWGERHPWADEREGWDGLVMLFTPQSDCRILQSCHRSNIASIRFLGNLTKRAPDRWDSRR
jgi:hypothetical protein